MIDTEYTGTTGVIEFGDADSEFPHDVLPDRTSYPITQWIDGGKECVFPREAATADHVAPEWL